jgi:CMP/dCMP kinase
MNIAIDGPAGSGKSTIAKILSGKLGFIYVDTGAMYRAIALYCIRKGIQAEEENKIEGILPEIQVSIVYENGSQIVYLNGEDVSGEIRTPQVSAMTSPVAAYAAVRDKLLDLQRKLAEENDVVMDGRDIGTHVLPNAELKIYLTASVKTRALRRFKELEEKGDNTPLEEIEQSIRERDERDMNREIAPLKQAEDAYYLDSSDLTIEEVVSEMEKLVAEKR